MTTFAAPASALDSRTPDATKHVNYNLGMLLGVDDFTQDFGYLSARDRWLARDAIGYGTLSGLQVTVDKTSKGPRITVTSGTALTPRGQLVCVAPAQCGYVNDWLTANKTQVPALLGSPVANMIGLYLTLCYRDCAVDPVPIPGEPCRSEDELMQPSRLVDNFSLELRGTAPSQAEEDLLRELAVWIRALNTGGNAAISDVEAALRSSLVGTISSPPASPIASPPAGSGLHIVFGAAAAALRLDAAAMGDYVRAIFRVWAAEIRPRVHAICAGGAGCCGADGDSAPATDECLLLARINVPLVNAAGEWRASDVPGQDVTIDQSRRPVIAHLRLVDELLGGGGGGAGGPRVVAAGLVGISSSASPRFGNLTVALQGSSVIRLNFDGYDPARRYIVKAISNTSLSNPTIAYDSPAPNGLLMRVTRGAVNINDVDLSAAQFMIEVSQVG